MSFELNTSQLWGLGRLCNYERTEKQLRSEGNVEIGSYVANDSVITGTQMARSGINYIQH